ncbi:MAG: glycyl-radical enzyme activating protein [Dehalococcoidia bacterium]|nr:glycyl-radical enzyme activating protein [Dehalococcoidia bacterium]
MTGGVVFDIQRFSLQDGPGLRTIVFLKGCPLRCAWCSNPESQQPAPQLLYDGDRCTLCLSCVPVCPSGALTSAGEGALSYDLTLCTTCGACVSACPNAARSISGKQMSVDEVLAAVLRDAPFYRRSGGGVTLSGGEPTLQPDFAKALLQAFRQHGMDTAIETCGYADTRTFISVVEQVDHVFFDVKHMNSTRHMELTRVPNELILDNLRALMHIHPDVTVRYPLIPDCNDGGDDLRSFAQYLLRLPRMPLVEFVPYHRYGEHKYRLLGRPYSLNGTPSCEEGEAERACQVLRQHEITCSALHH